MFWHNNCYIKFMRLAGFGVIIAICTNQLACGLQSYPVLCDETPNEVDNLYKRLDHYDVLVRDDTTAALIKMWQFSNITKWIEYIKSKATAENNEEVIQRSSYILDRMNKRRALGSEIVNALDEKMEHELGEIVSHQDITDPDTISKLIEAFETWINQPDVYEINGESMCTISKWLASKLKYLCFKREFIQLVRDNKLRNCLDGIMILINDKDLHEFIDELLHALLLADKEYAKNIVELLEHNHHKVRISTIKFLETLRWTEYTKEIVNRLKDSSKNVRYCAIKALTEFGAKEHVDDIAELFNDDELRGFVIKSITNMGTNRYKDTIAKYLNDPSSYTRGEAAESLGKFQAHEYAKEIAKLLNDKDDSVKCSAIIALRYLKAKEYAANVADFLKYYSSYFIRGNAALTLGEMGAKEYIPQIRELLKSSCDYTKWYALLALQQLDADGTFKEYSQKNEDEVERLTVIFKD